MAAETAGRAFVYVQEPDRTIRYEIDHDATVLRCDIFARDAATQPYI